MKKKFNSLAVMLLVVIIFLKFNARQCAVYSSLNNFISTYSDSVLDEEIKK